MVFEGDAALLMIPRGVTRFSRGVGFEKRGQQIVMAMSSTLREDAGLFFPGKIAVSQKPSGGEPLQQWTQRREAKD